MLEPINEESAIPKDIDKDEHKGLILTQVKIEVWKRDKGRCVICQATKNLHYDHDLPFSKGGSSLTEKNVRILCAKCNLKKHDKIE
ncbi:HNH endonuclease [Candidatus Woesearchaeota archaeon]|nr:HNH endonuclease [Candidatus Woesearchaeota archaeon]